MKRLIHIIFVPFLIFILWWGVSQLKIFSPYLLPNPQTTWQAFLELCQNGILFKNVAVSLGRVIIGFLCAVVVALPLGIFCGRSKFFKDFCWTTLEFLRHVPPLAAVPLIILWFGIDEVSKIVIIFLASFFPLFLNTYSGIKNCDTRLIEVGKALHFTEVEQVKNIILPSALPSIVTGLQLSLGYSWRALIGAELIAAASGIGYMILDAEEMSRPDIVLVGIFTIGVIGTIIDGMFFALAKKALPWEKKVGAE